MRTPPEPPVISFAPALKARQLAKRRSPIQRHKIAQRLRDLASHYELDELGVEPLGIIVSLIGESKIDHGFCGSSVTYDDIDRTICSLGVLRRDLIAKRSERLRAAREAEREEA